MTPSNVVWVVDDERSIRWVLDKALSKEAIEVTCFEDSESLLFRLESATPNVILSDIRMLGMDGLELMEKVNSSHPDIPVIIMTAHSDLDSAVASIQGGAFEYIPKPFEVEELVSVVKRALHHQLDSQQVTENNHEVLDTEIIGKAPAMQEVFARIQRVAPHFQTLLINGATGTGTRTRATRNA